VQYAFQIIDESTIKINDTIEITIVRDEKQKYLALKIYDSPKYLYRLYDTTSEKHSIIEDFSYIFLKGKYLQLTKNDNIFTDTIEYANNGILTGYKDYDEYGIVSDASEIADFDVFFCKKDFPVDIKWFGWCFSHDTLIINQLIKSDFDKYQKDSIEYKFLKIK